MLAPFSSPTAETTPRKRLERASALAVAREARGGRGGLGGAGGEKSGSRRLTGTARSRSSTRVCAPAGRPHAAGRAPSVRKISLEACQVVQRGAPNAMSVSRGAAWPWLLVGHAKARNICQE